MNKDTKDLVEKIVPYIEKHRSDHTMASHRMALDIIKLLPITNTVVWKDVEKILSDKVKYIPFYEGDGGMGILENEFDSVVDLMIEHFNKK